jgi:hypothetical protein
MSFVHVGWVSQNPLSPTYWTSADTLEFASLVCELGLSILAALFVHLDRTADTSSASTLEICDTALAYTLVLTAIPVFMGLRYVCVEHRQTDRSDEPVESSDNPCDEVEAQQTAAAHSNPLHAQDDS